MTGRGSRAALVSALAAGLLAASCRTPPPIVAPPPPRDLIVLTIGEPIGKAGGTNTMKIVKVGENR